jgi:hypothetical protein
VFSNAFTFLLVPLQNFNLQEFSSSFHHHVYIYIIKYVIKLMIRHYSCIKSRATHILGASKKNYAWYEISDTFHKRYNLPDSPEIHTFYTLFPVSTIKLVMASGTQALVNRIDSVFVHGMECGCISEVTKKIVCSGRCFHRLM